MASKALSKTSRAVWYFPNLRAFVNRTRSSMVAYMQLSTSSIGTASHRDKKITGQQWSEKRLGPFAQKDPRFPLPGNMGIPVDKKEDDITTPISTRNLVNVFLEVNAEDSQKLRSLGSFLNDLEEEGMDSATASEKQEVNKEQIGTVECTIQTCPKILHRGFMELFPEKTLKPGELTVISVSQHSKNDMSIWSMEVQEEREALMKNFVESAKEICGNLSAAGYWADFIDPSSGTASFGPRTNSTLFETDDRFNHLGFDVLDLGCCKAISHHLWGTHAFVGSIFTNAPAECEILGQALQN
ncbi:methylmalonic aciduria and homocystinuria type D protein, mitochondrial-like [Actinia tenebrosa]|uniref:Methylmalonic aciduria and homocystinuria type D protein, mitochondrial-like n=1 Tax=Actinia tenebrosa TaxID=6105 RepID=A0A6P8HJC3_ACTTE|nr:methylmalonic aciduria and homocystinuria type D protein, mitochondrial-like [Actinia tenebrosa]